MKNNITKLNFQRNGVAGEPFYSLLLSRANGKKGKFLATFEPDTLDGEIYASSCRVVNLENPLESWDGRNIAFEIEKELRILMTKYNLFTIYELSTKLRSLDLSANGYKLIETMN